MSGFANMRGRSLDKALADFNVVRRTESDDELIQRAREQLGLIPNRGTVSDVEGQVDRALVMSRPVGTSVRAVKRELAIIWLGRQRPAGFFAGLRWWLDLFRRVRGAS